MKKFYITTSIAYTNASPHIGFALELIQADLLARFHKAKGEDVFFLTGTDEHGTKIERTAKEKGTDPQSFVDCVSKEFKVLADTLDISNDFFVRTTDKKNHWPGVEKIWKAVLKDLYKKKYKGLYCFGCEAFLSQKDLVEGKCPNHNREPEEVEEENWFFRLSKYSKEIERKIESDELRIVPESKKKEILSFIKEGVEDISVSRSKDKLSWGIPVPGDESQKIYVWLDALTNYISAIGYGRDEKNFNRFWPANVHCIGKDILRFHAVIWPGMLLSAGLPLPKTVFVHGFITSEGKKMSKSLGNVIDPKSLIEKYGADAVRYFFLSEIPSSGDGDFSEKRFIERYNSDLADGLGNLLARVSALSKKNNIYSFDADKEVAEKVKKVKKESSLLIEQFRFNEALSNIWSLIHFADGYIEEKRPWEKKEDNAEVINNLRYILLNLSDILFPFIPSSAKEAHKILENGEKKILFPKIQN